MSRGDAATARSQICYASADPKGNVYLVFESGEVQYAAYLFEGGPKRNGRRPLCEVANSYGRTEDGFGVGAGMTRSQVESILGKPTASKGDKLVHFRQVKEKNSPEILRRLRREHPDISNEEFHRDYDFSDLTVYIEVSSPARRSTTSDCRCRRRCEPQGLKAGFFEANDNFALRSRKHKVPFGFAQGRLSTRFGFASLRSGRRVGSVATWAGSLGERKEPAVRSAG